MKGPRGLQADKGFPHRNKMSSISRRSIGSLREEMRRHQAVLLASPLCKRNIQQIIRLKADKICEEEVCAKVGCRREEVLAAQWEPQGRNSYKLFGLDKGKLGSAALKEMGMSWAAFKATEEYKIYEEIASSEKEAEETVSEEWATFLEGRCYLMAAV